jgi:hypothetical protein
MFLCILSATVVFFLFLKQIDVAGYLQPLLALSLFLGSTSFFLCVSDAVFHEAILWGATMAIWAYYWFGRYLQTSRTIFLVLGAAFSFGSFFSRFTTGMGTLLCAFWVGLVLVKRRSYAHATIPVIAITLSAAMYLMENYQKFGGIWDPMPFRYHVQYDAKRLAHVNGTLFHPNEALSIAAFYFNPSHIRFIEDPPFLALTDPVETPSTPLDLTEPFAALPVAMPALFGLATAGLVFILRTRIYQWTRPLLFSALASGLSLLAIAGITYRYEHDWYPFLFLGAILGAAAISRIESKKLRWIAVTSFAVAAIWSVAANIGFVLQTAYTPGTFAW